MASKTNIEWTEFNWNFLRGCKRVSEGCRNCYAETIAGRFSGEGLPYHGLATQNGEARWTGEIAFDERTLLAPLKRKKPTVYFVNSMSDLFYEKVTDEMIDKAFAVMALCPQHTFQILTKRPERMRQYFDRLVADVIAGALPEYGSKEASFRLPLSNVWLGVSVEDQRTADERIPLLLDTPASVRWISAEPLLGPVNLVQTLWTCVEEAVAMSFSHSWNAEDRTMEVSAVFGIDWCVVGGESGSGARPCDIDWIRSIVGQCKSADVPVFVKQLGRRPKHAVALRAGEVPVPTRFDLRDRKGGKPDEWPEDLRVREFPQRGVV